MIVYLRKKTITKPGRTLSSKKDMCESKYFLKKKTILTTKLVPVEFVLRTLPFFYWRGFVLRVIVREAFSRATFWLISAAITLPLILHNGQKNNFREGIELLKDVEYIDHLNVGRSQGPARSRIRHGNRHTTSSPNPNYLLFETASNPRSDMEPKSNVIELFFFSLMCYLKVLFTAIL